VKQGRSFLVYLSISLAPSAAFAEPCADAGLTGPGLAACVKSAGPCKYNHGQALIDCEQRAVERGRNAAAAPTSTHDSYPVRVAPAPEPEVQDAPAPQAPVVPMEQRRADVAALQAAAARVEALGNRSEWTLSDSTTEQVGKNVPMMQQKLEKQREAMGAAAALQQVLDGFRERYLAHLESWQSPYEELNQAFEDLTPFLGSRAYAPVEQGLQAITEAPARNASRCLAILQMNTEPSVLAALNEIYRTKAIAEARAMLAICPAFQPDEPGIASATESLRPLVEATLTKYRAEELAAIQGRSWQPNVASVSVGAPAALASAGLAYLRQERSWGGDTARGTQVLALSVRGDWFVAERDLFGTPTRWGLPIHAAIVNQDSMEGVAQVYGLSLVTTGASKQAPFGAYRVGDTWLLLRDKVR